MNLARLRCFQHTSREAVARCPECGRDYCRECVTEHEGRVLCRSCLESHSASEESHSVWGPRVVRLAMAASGFAILFIAFQIIGRWLARTPELFQNLP